MCSNFLHTQWLVVRDDVGTTSRRLAQFAALSLSMVLYKPPSLVVNVFAYAETMEYSRGRRTFERTRRVDLDVNYRSAGPDGGRARGKTRALSEGGRRRREEKKTPTAHSQRQARLDGAELVALVVVNKAVTLLSHRGINASYHALGEQTPRANPSLSRIHLSFRAACMHSKERPRRKDARANLLPK